MGADRSRRSLHALLECGSGMSAEPKVVPGQLWADNDPRAAVRTLRVLAVDEGKATCRIETNDTDTQAALENPNAWHQRADRRGKATTIALTRMVPSSTGYRLVGEEPCDCIR